MPYLPKLLIDTSPVLVIVSLLAIPLGPAPALAQVPVHPALDPSIVPNMQRIALGDWGESVVATQFRARGLEVVDFTVGPHGLDQVAFKRDASGSLVDVRAVEVKTRTAAGDAGVPGTSRNGIQLTAEKLEADLRLAASRHPDPKVRDLAEEILALRSRQPAAVRVERHVLTVKDGRYTVYEGATRARPVGRPVADGSIERIFSRLGQSSNPETAAAARLNLAYLRNQQAARSIAAESTAATRGLRTANFAPMRMVTPTSGSALSAVTAGTATFVAVAGIAAYDWYQGTISDARLHEEILRAGGDGITVALATGTVLILSPAAPGVVLAAVAVGVALATDAAFDWAMERENEHLIDRELLIRYGSVPDIADVKPDAALPPLRNPLADSLRAPEPESDAGPSGLVSSRHEPRVPIAR